MRLHSNTPWLPGPSPLTDSCSGEGERDVGSLMRYGRTEIRTLFYRSDLSNIWHDTKQNLAESVFCLGMVQASIKESKVENRKTLRTMKESPALMMSRVILFGKTELLAPRVYV